MNDITTEMVMRKQKVLITSFILITYKQTERRLLMLFTAPIKSRDGEMAFCSHCKSKQEETIGFNNPPLTMKDDFHC